MRTWSPTRSSWRPHGQHDWYTVGDTALDHAAVLDLRDLLRTTGRGAGRPGGGDRREPPRCAAARGRGRWAPAGRGRGRHRQPLSPTCCTTSCAAARSSTATRSPRDDLAAYLHDQDRAVFERHREWIEALPVGMRLEDLIRAAAEQGDPQLVRLVRAYLPLTFSRRHGDPSRPWNRFSIRVRDEAGAPVYRYEGNWRDIFQNWEALGESFPGFLPQFISVFLDASTADGYNPYRITRSGHRLGGGRSARSVEPHRVLGRPPDRLPAAAAGRVRASRARSPRRRPGRAGVRLCGCAVSDRRISPTSSPIRAGRSCSIRRVTTRSPPPGGTSARTRPCSGMSDGEVRLVTLGEKLLVPLLVKLTNLVPGSGIWLNTQRPEWNDANNALAGWGLSLVTLSAICRYLGSSCADCSPATATVELSQPVARLLDERDRHPRRRRRPGRRRGTVRDHGSPGSKPARITGTRSTPGTSASGGHARGDRSGRSSRPGEPRARRPSGPARGRTACTTATTCCALDGERASVEPPGADAGGPGRGARFRAAGATPRSIALLRALRASEPVPRRPAQLPAVPGSSDRPLPGPQHPRREPPLADPPAVRRRSVGAWHFQADLSTLARRRSPRLSRSGAEPVAADDRPRPVAHHLRPRRVHRSQRPVLHVRGPGQHLLAHGREAGRWPCSGAIGRATDPAAAEHARGHLPRHPRRAGVPQDPGASTVRSRPTPTPTPRATSAPSSRA